MFPIPPGSTIWIWFGGSLANVWCQFWRCITQVRIQVVPIGCYWLQSFRVQLAHVCALRWMDIRLLQDNVKVWGPEKVLLLSNPVINFRRFAWNLLTEKFYSRSFRKTFFGTIFMFRLGFLKNNNLYRDIFYRTVSTPISFSNVLWYEQGHFGSSLSALYTMVNGLLSYPKEGQ